MCSIKTELTDIRGICVSVLQEELERILEENRRKLEAAQAAQASVAEQQQAAASAPSGRGAGGARVAPAAADPQGLAGRGHGIILVDAL
jgi:hypothetical protein